MSFAENSSDWDSQPIASQQAAVAGFGKVFLRQALVSGLLALGALIIGYWVWLRVLAPGVCLWLLGNGQSAEQIPENLWISCAVIGPGSLIRLPLILLISLVTAGAVWLVGKSMRSHGSFLLSMIFVYSALGILSLAERIFPQAGEMPITENTIEIAILAVVLSGIPGGLGYHLKRIVMGDEALPLSLLTKPATDSAMIETPREEGNERERA